MHPEHPLCNSNMGLLVFVTLFAHFTPLTYHTHTHVSQQRQLTLELKVMLPGFKSGSAMESCLHIGRLDLPTRITHRVVVSVTR